MARLEQSKPVNGRNIYMPMRVRFSNMMSSTPNAKTQSTTREELEQEFREWWEQKNEGWDSDGGGGATESENLWDHMPTIDSKAVTRAGASISEGCSNVQFDPTMIQPGGYSSIDGLVDDLVPKMLEGTQEKEN